MLRKIFNAIFGIAESTVKESISETKTVIKWYAYAGLFLIISLALLFIFGIIAIIF